MGSAMSFWTDDHNDITGSHARLREEVERLRAENESLRRQVATVEAENLAFEDREALLMATLRPFAEYADGIHRDWPDDTFAATNSTTKRLTAGDFRVARNALNTEDRR